MLDAVEQVVGTQTAPAWKHVLRGLWESAFRLDELMNMSWDNPHQIRPTWPEGRHGIIHIPHAMQKSDTEEDIPLLPWFETLLKETPAEQRIGPIFNPPPPKPRAGVGPRLQTDRVSKIISKIGKQANIIVDHGDLSTGRGPKYASAHDLRRSCGQRLEDAGVPPTLIARVMRHQSWDTTRKHYVPGDVQKDAAKLKKLLDPPTEPAKPDRGKPDASGEAGPNT